MDKQLLRIGVFNFLSTFGEAIGTKFRNISGKTGQYNVPGELFQKRTHRKNRVLIPWKDVKNNNLTMEMLETFSGGVTVDFINNDFFDENNEIYPVFSQLKRKLGSNEKVASIISINELHPKSGTQDWRCSFFVSKLTREDKIKIYERRKNGETIPSLAKAFNVQESNIKYLIALIKKHGYNILREDKNRVYSKDFKLQTINRILINHESINSVAIDIGLISSSILDNWLSKFKENGYNVVEKKKGRKPKSMTKLKKNDKTLSEKEKIKQLEEENLYLKAENEYLKKLKALVQERKLKEKKK